MLRNDWYVLRADWFAELANAPQLGDTDEEAITHLGQVFADTGSFDPAVTVAATHMLLIAVERLGVTMKHAAEAHDTTDLNRLLLGLNHAQSHLAELNRHIATGIAARTFRGMPTVSPKDVRTLVEHLREGGTGNEAAAGRLKATYLLLRGIGH